jgi:hypothetical protein
MSLEEIIKERMSFVKERINPKNTPEINSTFQVQIEVLRSADVEKVTILVLRKR